MSSVLRHVEVNSYGVCIRVRGRELGGEREEGRKRKKLNKGKKKIGNDGIVRKRLEAFTAGVTTIIVA